MPKDFDKEFRELFVLIDRRTVFLEDGTAIRDKVVETIETISDEATREAEAADAAARIAAIDEWVNEIPRLRDECGLTRPLL